MLKASRSEGQSRKALGVGTRNGCSAAMQPRVPPIADLPLLATEDNNSALPSGWGKRICQDDVGKT